MRSVKILLGAYALLIVSGCIQAPQKAPKSWQVRPGVATNMPWQLLTSKAGRFSILVPGRPEESISTQASKLGPLRTHRFVLKARQGDFTAAYLLDYVDYPQRGVRAYDPHFFLEQFVEGGFGDLRLNYQKRIRLGSHAGIEFQHRMRADASSPLHTGRAYLVGNRMYLLGAIMRRPLLEQGCATKYLDSFRAQNS